MNQLRFHRIEAVRVAAADTISVGALMCLAGDDPAFSRIMDRLEPYFLDPSSLVVAASVQVWDDRRGGLSRDRERLRNGVIANFMHVTYMHMIHTHANK